MKASEVNSMSMVRQALSGMPGQNASIVSGISYQGEKRLGYDCGIPMDPYATNINAQNPSQRGKRVLIGDFNKIIQLVGTGLYMRQRGAANEFDPRVVEIDKGAKSETGLYGYPNGAVLDWWNGSTFKKVICIKTADPNIAGDEDGNCTVGPDDPDHGVSGTKERYWKEIGIEPQTPIRWVYSTINSVSDFDSSTGEYVIQRPALMYAQITVSAYIHWIAPHEQIKYFLLVFYVNKGDRVIYDSHSISINSRTFYPSASNITTVFDANSRITDVSIYSVIVYALEYQ